MNSRTHVEWHCVSPEETLESLETRPEGLSTKEAQERLARHGENTIERRGDAGPLKMVLNQLNSPLVYILIAAAIITASIQHWADVIVIGIVIVVNTVVGFIQEFRAENAVQALIELSAPRASVRRDGRDVEVASAEVVPGDIALLAAGGIVPAEVRLIETSRLHFR